MADVTKGPLIHDWENAKSSLVKVSMEASQITKQRPCTWHGHDTLGYQPKVLYVNMSQKCLHATVYCSTDHHSFIMEPTYSSNNKGGWEILSSHYIEQGYTICKTMDSIANHTVNWDSLRKKMFSLICGASILYRYIKSFTHTRAHTRKEVIWCGQRGAKEGGEDERKGREERSMCTSDTHLCENGDIALKDPVSKHKRKDKLAEGHSKVTVIGFEAEKEALVTHIESWFPSS